MTDTVAPEINAPELSTKQQLMKDLAAAQKELVRAQATMVKAHQLAKHIPMYERMGKIITELRNMMIEVPKLPL